MNTVVAKKKEYRKWLILANVSLGTFMATLDGSITNVALPSISHALTVPLNIVQWVITAYLLTIAALLPIVGKLSDSLGRGRLYQAGFLTFVVGSIFCGLSGSIWMLIVGRIIQAAGAALLMGNSQAIVASTFSKAERGRSLGITGTVVSLGSLTGPAVGGMLVGSLGWESIFWVNVPIGLLAFLAGIWILPKEKLEQVSEPFDYTGSLLYMVGIVVFLYVLSNVQVWGWSSIWTIAGLVGAIGLLIGFYKRETSISFPMLDFSLYRIRTFRVGSLAALLSFISLFCITVMMPFYMQNVLDYSPHIIGYVMMANPLVMALVAPLSGWLSDRIGPFFLTTGGLLLNAVSFAMLTTLGTKELPWQIALHLALFGLGTGMFQSPNNASVLGAVPPIQLGRAGGLNALVRNLGMVLGTTFSVSLFSFQFHRLAGSGERFMIQGEAYSATFIAALHSVFGAAAVICLFGAFASARRGKPVR